MGKFDSQAQEDTSTRVLKIKIDGDAGGGKTFAYDLIAAALRAKGELVIDRPNVTDEAVKQAAAKLGHQRVFVLQDE